MEKHSRIEKLEMIVNEIREANSGQNFTHEADFLMGMLEAVIEGQGKLKSDFLFQAFVRLSESECNLGGSAAHDLGELVSELCGEEAEQAKFRSSSMRS